MNWGWAERDCSQGVGQRGLGERNSMVVCFSAEKFGSMTNSPGFPWTHQLLPSGIKGVQKFAGYFEAGFTQIFLRSCCVARMQTKVIAVAGNRLS